MDKSNFNSLKEMLLDERKLVTYVSLSKEMCIHVNESKSLLKQVVDYLKKNEPDIQLNINYMISGLIDNNKAKTTVCNETELKSLKCKLKAIFYQHLYSVSVGPPVVDNVLLMALNKFADFPLCTGLVKSQSCVKRTSVEIGGLKTNSQENVIIEKKASISGLKVVKEEKMNPKENTLEVKQVTKIQETKSEPIIKSEIPSPKKDSLQSKNSNKSQKGIAGFFSKSNSLPAKKVVNGIEDTEQKKKTEQEKPQMADVVLKVKAEEMEVDEVEPEKPTKDTNKKETVKETKNKNKSLSTIKKNAKVEKKRKRVLHVSDSESEDEKNDPFFEEPKPELDLDSEDEIPPTPLANTVKITSGIMNPKKKRKIVDKTYTDEDGYILTKKEEVYESCSENEEEVNVKENLHHVNKVKPEVSPPEKKNGTKTSKKKMASPQKGKQATLMSFFKKVPQK